MTKLYTNILPYIEFQDLLIERAGHECQECGSYHDPHVNRPLRLCFHDGNMHNREPDNVRVLCYPCIRERNRQLKWSRRSRARQYSLPTDQ